MKVGGNRGSEARERGNKDKKASARNSAAKLRVEGRRERQEARGKAVNCIEFHGLRRAAHSRSHVVAATVHRG